MTSRTEGSSPPAETGDLSSSSDNAIAFAAEHARNRLHLRHHALAAPLMDRSWDCALAPARAGQNKLPHLTIVHRLPLRTPRVWTVPLHPPTLGRYALCVLELPAMPHLRREQHVAWQFHPSAMRTRDGEREHGAGNQIALPVKLEN